MNDINKRKFKRLSASWIVRIRTRKPADSTRIRINQRIRNVSMGGVFIDTRHPFRVGSMVEFDFTVPGSTEMIRAKGLVKWSNDGSQGELPAGMGIEFLEVSTTSRDAISDYLEQPASANLVGPLTCDDNHRALLKFYTERVGETFKLPVLSSQTGVPHEKLIATLSDFALYDLVGFSGDSVAFNRCQDEKLAEAIKKWSEEDHASA